MIADKRDMVRDWLAAERAGRSEEADRVFSSLAQALPKRRPPGSFAAGVMARVNSAAAQPAGSWWAWWGVRAGVAASVLTLGLVLGSWSARSMFFTAIAAAQSVAWGLDQVVTGSVVWIETGLTLWGSAAHAAVVVGRLLVAPGPAMLVGANLAIAVCAFAALRRLLVSQED